MAFFCLRLRAGKINAGDGVEEFESEDARFAVRCVFCMVMLLTLPVDTSVGFFT
jgi:hypothetical protein